MSELQNYLQPFITDNTLSFPNTKSEDYRYSSVVKKFTEVLTPVNGTVISIPWESDFIFYSDQKTEGLPVKNYNDLPKVYHRHQNYFKQAGLGKDNNFYEITCESEKIILTFAASKNSVMSEKVYIHAPAKQTTQIFINFLSEENSLMIPIIFVDAQADSHVELIYSVNRQHNIGVISPTFELTTQENSHVSLQSFTEGIENHRLTFMGYLLGAKSHIDLRTGFYLQKEDACDLYVRIFHEAPDSTSNQMIKAVTLDSSTMNFNGQIYANGEAHNIYAYQMLKGMLLGEKSQIFARPQLDIEYYELACSHGVSIGGFDPEEIFYLKSRGINDKDIYPILLYGFFCESFIDIPLEKYWNTRIQSLLGTNIQ